MQRARSSHTTGFVAVVRRSSASLSAVKEAETTPLSHGDVLLPRAQKWVLTAVAYLAPLTADIHQQGGLPRAVPVGPSIMIDTRRCHSHIRSGEFPGEVPCCRRQTRQLSFLVARAFGRLSGY